ncbi:amidohydrolase family protein [Kitasatospora griseola]|uniref:amidohydrolase family protein n=1 Tax=Kitasatospora griseola TaxID=2064 RepID=UPI0009F9C07E|nr:amidohydrolase family protein [Kitasatospora griseola]
MGSSSAPSSACRPSTRSSPSPSTPPTSNFEQDLKGSIEVGKLADLVVLSANPLTVPPEEIKDIELAETIKRGTTIHSAAGANTDDPGSGLEAPTDYQWHGCC